jgi:capsid portal protein
VASRLKDLADALLAFEAAVRADALADYDTLEDGMKSLKTVDDARHVVLYVAGESRA